MKRFVLSLGLVLMLIGFSWPGDFKMGITPAMAESTTTTLCPAS